MLRRHEMPERPVPKPQIVLQQRVVVVALALFGLANLLLLRQLQLATGGFGLWTWIAFCLPYATLGLAIRLVDAAEQESGDAVGVAARILREAQDGAAAPRILVVDDSAVNRRVVRLTLERAGYRVDEARDGMRASALAVADAYDLILMDVHMPRRSGIEATRVIRGAKSASADAPIVAMTARAMGDDVQEFLDAGMVGHVGKPVEGPALLAAVERWLHMHTNDDSPATPDALPVLAPGALDELRSYGDGEDDAILIELANMFFRGAAENIATMRESHAERDLQRFERAAHSLKGSAGTLGAQRLAERCRGLEANARAGKLPENPLVFDQLQSMVAEIREALEASLGLQLV